MSAAIHITDNEIWAEQIAVDALEYYVEASRNGQEIYLETALIMMEPDLPMEVLNDAHLRLVEKANRWAFGRLH